MTNAGEMIAVKHLDSWDTWLDDLKDSGLDIAPMVERSVDAIYRYLCEGYTYQVQYSAGKDSETVLGLFLLALMRAKRNGVAVSPHHFLIHVDTGIENPEVRTLADSKMSSLDSFIQANNLPLQTYIARPSLVSAWASRIIGGRGLPTFVSTKFRQCTHELKITGANRMVALHKKTMPKAAKDKIIMLLGSRDDEGKIRANNIAKHGGEECTISKSGNKFSLYPIKSWLSENVWEYLSYSGNRRSSVLPSYLEDHFKTVDLYRDSGAGECVVFQADDQDGGSGQSSCGSRHGCAFCLAAGVDKSMQTLLETDPERYGYMKGLNRIQRYLEYTRHDWSLRHPVGRTIYDAGYIKIQPDVYSPAMLARLLHALISFDYLEQQRAQEHKRKLLACEIEDNELNRRFANAQFQIIDERQLVAIEFLWSLHHFQKLPFTALDIWHKVYTHGELELLEEVDTMTPVAKTPQPKPFWLKINSWDDGSIINGLTDFWQEMTYFDNSAEQSHKTINTDSGTRRVVDYVENDLFDVDHDAAEFIVWNEYSRLKGSVMDGMHTPYYSASYLLRFGAVQLGKGQGARYNTMAQRGQTYHALGLTGQLSMEEIYNREDLKPLILDDKAYKELEAEAKAVKAKYEDEQAAIQAKKDEQEQKRKAWAKKHPKEVRAAKAFKSHLDEQRYFVGKFQTLFTMATSIHAEMQTDALDGKEVTNTAKILKGLGNEIAFLREKLDEQHKHHVNQYQLECNELWLEILTNIDNDRYEFFHCDHIKHYARKAPERLRQELTIAIEHLKAEIAKYRPVKKRSPWYEANSKKTPCPAATGKAAAASQIALTLIEERQQHQMELDVFLAA